MKVVAFILLHAASAFANQTYPGTSSRPILSSTEAASYTKAKFLQGWSPETISTTTADFTVGNGFSTIQAAVNAAIQAGGTTRKHISVPAGNFSEVIYIPNTNVPITIYGAGSTKTIVSLSLSATLTGPQYRAKVGRFFASGDPAFNMFSQCANKTAIGTGCSNVVWILASGVQIVNMEIENSSALNGTDQAVALQSSADKIQLDNLRLIGHQDTLYSGSFGTTIQRSHVTNSFISGDIDFVFGGGTTVFEKCTFHARADRRSDIAVIFAPNTHPNNTYGFLAVNSTFTGDSAFASSKQAFLARSWDTGVANASSYIAGTSANGQVVIRESVINGIIQTLTPYTHATSGRAYVGNVATTRNLNDNTKNRFWEFANTGNAA